MFYYHQNYWLTYTIFTCDSLTISIVWQCDWQLVHILQQLFIKCMLLHVNHNAYWVKLWNSSSILQDALFCSSFKYPIKYKNVNNMFAICLHLGFQQKNKIQQEEPIHATFMHDDLFKKGQIRSMKWALCFRLKQPTWGYKRHLLCDSGGEGPFQA